jgi:hypothetical protein
MSPRQTARTSIPGLTRVCFVAVASASIMAPHEMGEFIDVAELCSLMSQLLTVAEYLALRALGVAGDDADAFGRSAFNRFYYAAYLSVRDLLIRIDDAWGRQSHKTVPDLLEQAVLHRMRQQAKKLAKTGVLTHARQQQINSQANMAAADIASILRGAYTVRVTADYAPEVRVTFISSGFRLENHSFDEARLWHDRIGKSKSTLLRISRELGIVN